MEAERTHLTSANEDYLEAIVRLEESQGKTEVRSVDIANLLDVSKASVNKALATLRADGYIEQERYGRITLTPEGRTYGREVWDRHQSLRNFLTNDLGVDFDTANEEACMMEHALSQDTMTKWLNFLDEVHRERGQVAGEQVKGAEGEDEAGASAGVAGEGTGEDAAAE